MKWKPKQLKYRKLQQLTGEISVSQPFYTCDIRWWNWLL